MSTLSTTLVENEDVLRVIRAEAPSDITRTFLCATNARLIVCRPSSPTTKIPAWILWSDIQSIDTKFWGTPTFQCIHRDGTTAIALNILGRKPAREEFVEAVEQLRIRHTGSSVEDRVRERVQMDGGNIPACIPFDEATHGKIDFEYSFGRYSIRLTNRGFIQIANSFSKKECDTKPFARLLDISIDAHIDQKSGLGRAAGAALTGGLNLLSSSSRGDIVLVVTSELGVEVLQVGPSALATGHHLVASGRAAIRRQPDSHNANAPEPTTASVGDRLQQLGQLLDDGLVSDEEYHLRRSQIIDNL